MSLGGVGHVDLSEGFFWLIGWVANGQVVIQNKKLKLSHHRKRFKAPQLRWVLGPIGKRKTISQQEGSR